MGFLASVNNPDIYFKYCGYTFGLRHCLNEIYKRNPDTYYKLVETINLGILKNYQGIPKLKMKNTRKTYRNRFRNTKHHNLFFKLDNKVYKRFWKYLNSIE